MIDSWNWCYSWSQQKLHMKTCFLCWAVSKILIDLKHSHVQETKVWCAKYATKTTLKKISLVLNANMHFAWIVWAIISKFRFRLVTFSKLAVLNSSVNRNSQYNKSKCFALKTSSTNTKQLRRTSRWVKIKLKSGVPNLIVKKWFKSHAVLISQCAHVAKKYASNAEIHGM